MQVSACWDEASSYRDSLSFLTRLSTHHALKGGDVGKKILGLLERQDWSSLVALDVEPNREGWDVLELYHCRQALGFFTKLEDLDCGVDKKDVALEKFLAAERKCKSSNDLFRAVSCGSAWLRRSDMQVLLSARRKIRFALGRCPQVGELNLRFGPGATTSTKKKDACPRNKMAARMTCSTNLLGSGLLPSLLREVPHWAAEHSEKYSLELTGEDPVGYIDESGSIVQYDEAYLVQHVKVTVQPAKLSFVPKNSKTYRCTCTEPTLNTVLQSGIGAWIADRLRRIGINIKDQKRNQELAWLGSVLQGLATLDLSSASDTICTQLVKFLLPADWYFLLNSARTTMVKISNHGILEQEKFCSMGNGFTFPLETLIFWGITSACCEGKVSMVGVYGDDIICPTEHSGKVVSSLELCGFSINYEKSFTAGPFRESCGSDYYNGFDVRPYYQKDLVSAETLFTLHNFYFRAALDEEAALVRSFIPESLVLTGPDGYGDGHLLSREWNRYLPLKLREKGYNGYQFDTFSATGLKVKPRYRGDHVSPLYHVYSRGGEPVVPLPDFSELSETSKVDTDQGTPLWTLPGRQGYSRTTIYALG